MSTQPPDQSVGDPMETPGPMESMPAKWLPKRQCTAQSKQSGERCRRRPILGGTVCRMHGGAIPSVKRKAEERLRALVDPALGALEVWVKQRKVPAVSLAAAKDILDRNGHGGDKPLNQPGQTTVNVLALISPEALKDVIANAFSAGREER